jgi:hypothetical protein
MAHRTAHNRQIVSENQRVAARDSGPIRGMKKIKQSGGALSLPI